MVKEQEETCSGITSCEGFTAQLHNIRCGVPYATYQPPQPTAMYVRAYSSA